MIFYKRGGLYLTDTQIEDKIKNVQNEILFVGCFYKNPDLYVEYGKYIKSKYDFDDEATKFFYDNFELMYKTFTQTIDEVKVNTFMSQDKERFKQYRMYEGYKTIQTWMDLADTDDFDNYMNILKKYSLIREYYRKGYNVEKIINHKKFNLMDAKDIYKIIRAEADKIGTIILSNEESAILNEDATSFIKQWAIKPQMGLDFPFMNLNEMFRGMRKGKFFCNGFLSNEGKTRLVGLMAANTSLVHNEKSLVLANETSEEDFRACLLTTIINNKQFRELHGVNIVKPERELVLGIYRDDKNKIIERFMDENEEFIESEEEYLQRLYKTSKEFRLVLEVSKWLEEQYQNKIFFKHLNDFSDNSLDFEIRKHKIIHNTNYVFYDTLKPYRDENWAVLKQTATKLASLAIELDCFIWGSIQLTDDSVYTDIFNFSSNNIANAKQIKHVLDFLTLGKRLNKEEYSKYEYVPNGQWGEPHSTVLDLSKTYYGLKVDKNRGGSKDRIPLLEVDLDLNTWYEVGYLIKRGDTI